jgi:hypothetical protein
MEFPEDLMKYQPIVWPPARASDFFWSFGEVLAQLTSMHRRDKTLVCWLFGRSSAWLSFPASP